MSALKKVQVVFPSASSRLLGWTVTTVLDVTDFKGTSWYMTVDADVAVVIFIANQQGVDLGPIRKAVEDGRIVFVVTGREGAVSPGDIGVNIKEGKIYFFREGAKNIVQDVFYPFDLLGPALQDVLAGKSLEGLVEDGQKEGSRTPVRYRFTNDAALTVDVPDDVTWNFPQRKGLEMKAHHSLFGVQVVLAEGKINAVWDHNGGDYSFDIPVAWISNREDFREKSFR